jgi:hypothetical protein
MNSTPPKIDWPLSTLFSFVLPAFLFAAGCASHHTRPNAETAVGPKSPAELVTFYAVPFT